MQCHTASHHSICHPALGNLMSTAQHMRRGYGGRERGKKEATFASCPPPPCVPWEGDCSLQENEQASKAAGHQLGVVQSANWWRHWGLLGGVVASCQVEFKRRQGPLGGVVEKGGERRADNIAGVVVAVDTWNVKAGLIFQYVWRRNCGC